MTYIADLTTSRDNYAAKLAAISGLDEEKPSYSIDGRSISWTEYQAFLTENLDRLNDLILKANGAVTIRTQVFG